MPFFLGCQHMQKGLLYTTDASYFISTRICISYVRRINSFALNCVQIDSEHFHFGCLHLGVCLCAKKKQGSRMHWRSKFIDHTENPNHTWHIWSPRNLSNWQQMGDSNERKCYRTSQKWTTSNSRRKLSLFGRIGILYQIIRNRCYTVNWSRRKTA